MAHLPVSKELLGKSGSAYEHLRRSAILGELRPGRRLSPTDLAQYFSVSVTPVRDALVRLAAEDFVAWEVGRGYFTKPFTVGEQRDLNGLIVLLVRASLEELEAPVLATLLQTADLSGVTLPGGADAAIPTAEQLLGDIEGLSLAAASLGGNLIVSPMLKNALDRTHRIRRLDFEDEDRRAVLTADIRRAETAIRNGDRATALAVLRAQFLALRDRLPALVERANAEAQLSRFP